MTTIKLNSKVATNAQDALNPLVGQLYSNLGRRIIGVVELAAIERTQAAPDEDKEASVTLQIKHLEVAGEDQEETLRRALRALHVHRTAYGTLNEDGEIELSERTLALTAGELHSVEAARLRALVDHWSGYGRRVVNDSRLTATELRHELATIVDALYAAIHSDALVGASKSEG